METIQTRLTNVFAVTYASSAMLKVAAPLAKSSLTFTFLLKTVSSSQSLSLLN